MMARSDLRSEIVVVCAEPGTWWCHVFDKHGDSGVLLSTHKSKREAITLGARMAREMDLDLVVWRDAP